MKIKLFLLVITLVMAGCTGKVHKASDNNKVTSFYLNNINIALITGGGVIPDDTNFTSQEVLQKKFKKTLEKYLKERGIYSNYPTKNSAKVDIEIDYKRKLNWEISESKSDIAHSMHLPKDNKQLLEFQATGYTTKYAYLNEATLINIELIAFLWDQENRSSDDIDFISEKIAYELAETISK